MLVARLVAVSDLRVEEVPTPSPGPGEVLVEVGANTLCGTDGRILRGDKTAYVELPVVLGHEAAGRVADVGRGVVGYRVGIGSGCCRPSPTGAAGPVATIWRTCARASGS